MSRTHRIPPSGNPLIDQQHGRLNELIQQAALAARDSGDPVPFSTALADFRRALAHHFAVEKVIFSGAGFDAATGHDRAHAAILRHLDEVMASAGDLTTVQVRHRVLDELERIIIEHEMLEDAAYWDAVRAHSASPAIKWTPLMNVGIDWVDDHHRQMVDLLNRLSRAVGDGDGAAGTDLLRQFIALTQAHFAEEERYLEARGAVPGPHRTDHARMLAELGELMAAEEARPHILVDHYLRFWVMEHILGIDRQDLGG